MQGDSLIPMFVASSLLEIPVVPLFLPYLMVQESSAHTVGGLGRPGAAY